jgi:hypothetical protein
MSFWFCKYLCFRLQHRSLCSLCTQSLTLAVGPLIYQNSQLINQKMQRKNIDKLIGENLKELGDKKVYLLYGCN